MAAAKRGGRSETEGWWPYLLPYLGFLVAVELGARLPGDWDAALLLVKPALPGALVLYFARRGAYPELRRLRCRAGAAADALVGVALAGLWVAPYVWLPQLGPGDPSGFDPQLLGSQLVPLTLGLRLFGYAIVTPVFEELLIRSFVMRYSEVFSVRGDFREVPLAHFGWVSFLSTVVLFTLGHHPWEYWVAVPWAISTNLWFYYRKDLAALILVHAVTNATILAIVTAASLGVQAGDARSSSLWFLV